MKFKVTEITDEKGRKFYKAKVRRYGIWCDVCDFRGNNLTTSVEALEYLCKEYLIRNRKRKDKSYWMEVNL